MCCTRLTVNTGRKKSPFWHHRTTLSGYIFGTKACIDNRNTSSTCPDNMVNFGLLMAEIRWRVWGTPANFKGFRVLAALLHGTLVVGVSQTLQHWTVLPPIFGRATITLGIGPHSSFICDKVKIWLLLQLPLHLHTLWSKNISVTAVSASYVKNLSIMLVIVESACLTDIL